MQQARGHSNEKTDYSFVDLTPVSGYNYYRLKLVDINGAFDYSKIIVLENNIEPEKEFMVYPVPAAESVNLMYLSESSGEVDIQILNHLGQAVYTIQGHTLAKGTNRMTIDIQDLTPGWYAIEIRGENVSRVKSFVKK